MPSNTTGLPSRARHAGRIAEAIARIAGAAVAQGIEEIPAEVRAGIVEMLQHLDDRLAALVFAEEAVVVDAVLGEQGRERRAVIRGDRLGKARTAGPENRSRRPPVPSQCGGLRPILARMTDRPKPSEKDLRERAPAGGAAGKPQAAQGAGARAGRKASETEPHDSAGIAADKENEVGRHRAGTGNFHGPHSHRRRQAAERHDSDFRRQERHAAADDREPAHRRRAGAGKRAAPRRRDAAAAHPVAITASTSW